MVVLNPRRLGERKWHMKMLRMEKHLGEANNSVQLKIWVKKLKSKLFLKKGIVALWG